jgi:hypothetical protein
VHAEDAVRLFLNEELDLALSVQVRFGPRVGKEGEAPNFISYALLFQILLRLPNPCYLWVRIHHARDRVVVYMAMTRVDVLRRGDALLFCLVRKHRSEGDVTDALDVRHACVELVVDHDAPARVDFDTDVFKSEAVDVWPAADGNEDNVCLELLCKSILLVINVE